MSGTNLFVTNQ